MFGSLLADFLRARVCLMFHEGGRKERFERQKKERKKKERERSESLGQEKRSERQGGLGRARGGSWAEEADWRARGTWAEEVVSQSERGLKSEGDLCRGSCLDE